MKALGFVLGITLLAGCSSLATVDRSLVSAPLMSFTKTDADLLAPHTGLRGSSASSSGGCTVCAH
jgi:hypothetical protein